MELETAVRILKQKWERNPDKAEDEKEVISKYGKMFHPSSLDSLGKEDFKSFLHIKNNKHWDGIHRGGNKITEDMSRLIEALRILLNENKSIRERFDILRPKGGPSFIKHLGRAVLTPILFVVYPEKYAAYNSVSEDGMKELGLYPDFSGESLGERYERVNEIILEVAREHDLSLWQVDEMWWIATHHAVDAASVQDESAREVSFGLEKYLEGFLVSNWEKIDLANDLDIYEDENGDVVGQQFPTDVGRIDILCTDRRTGNFVVIELKKGRSSDTVLGQVLRYMGWVKHHLGKGGDVRGVIISNEGDEKLKYALQAVGADVRLITYEVSFELKEAV